MARIMCRHRHRRTEMTPVRVSNWVSNANRCHQISQGQCNQQLNRLDVSLHSLITLFEELRRGFGSQKLAVSIFVA